MPTSTTESALDAIQVFANSSHSVRVFEALADGPTTSRALAEQTGASRSTVARILADGETRGWVDSEGSQYELTDLGETMIDEFSDYLETIKGVHHLEEMIQWLPSPARELDFRHFRSADIITPTGTNPVKPFDYLEEWVRTGSKKRSLAIGAVTRFVQLIHDQCVAGKLESESVIQADWFDTLAAEPKQIPLWRTRAERGDVLIYDGEVPISFHVIDEAVGIWASEEARDVVRGLVVVENPAVVSWAESLYADYRAEAVLLDPAMLPEA
ncbi:MULTISPECIES: winged helix-turn-helix domain-containing protein [Halorussus]|uniref:helix-turn-helix transcriptional regulator n=1 Tax=Halorussus TaxID=1070314 RepID=UPI000E21018F|nr:MULTISPECIES: MarR family transcriptional regulator [Halorussus]NHN61572.1 helix-turn-helix domain-containing protein [Halorussus sp. JP-T4]